jgi:hypothetical protein
MELRLSEKASAGRALASALGIDPGSYEPIVTKRQVTQRPEGTGEDGKPLPETTHEIEETSGFRKRVSSFSPTTEDLGSTINQPITPVEVPLIDNFEKSTFPRKPKGKKRVTTVGANLTRLGVHARSLIRSVEDLSPTLASRMSVWLRGFSDERLQDAASKLALAQFDELFIADEVSDDDEDSVEDDESNVGPA